MRPGSTVEYCKVVDKVFLTKNGTKDLDALEDFVSDHIRNVPNVLVTSTMIISREYKAKNQRPKTK